MKRSFLLSILLVAIVLHSISQNTNSGFSPPVIIDTEHPQVEVLSPTGGEVLNFLLPLPVTWQAYDAHPAVLPINIGFSTVAGGDTLLPGDGFANTGTAEVPPPQVTTLEAKAFVKMNDAFGNTTIAASDGYFALSGCAATSVYAGSDATICVETNYFIADAFALNYGNLQWYTMNGSGDFVNGNSINTTYNPSAADYQNGFVSLILIVSEIQPCTGWAADTLQLYFQKLPTANAGENGTICQGENWQLNGTAANYSNLSWITSGDGIFNSSNIQNPVYFPGNGDINKGDVKLSLNVEPLQPCHATATDEVDISILLKYANAIPAGWSGLSSYVQPADANIETVMADVLGQLVIMYNYDNEIFYPAYDINTLNNWDSQKGYFIKVNDDATLNICGSKDGNLTLNLSSGWNIIPVLSSQDVPVTDVFAPLGSILTIIKEVAGYHIYYPEYGIYTLSSLISGKAYLVRVTEDCSITFPESFNKSQINNPHSFIDVPDTWGKIIPTPSSHQIIFPASITRSLNRSDVIGAFSGDGLCAGTIRIDDFDNANALTVFGDDAYTSSIDGMADGLEMSFKLFRSGTSEVFTINTEFTAGMNDGHFANNGISVVKAFSLVSVNELVSGFKPNIYPNPAKNIVTIEFKGLTNGTFDVDMMNAFGEVVKHGQSTETSANLDVSGLSRGVYYLRLTSGGQTFIEKLILQ